MIGVPTIRTPPARWPCPCCHGGFGTWRDLCEPCAPAAFAYTQCTARHPQHTREQEEEAAS